MTVLAVERPLTLARRPRKTEPTTYVVLGTPNEGASWDTLGEATGFNRESTLREFVSAHTFPYEVYLAVAKKVGYVPYRIKSRRVEVTRA